MYSPAALAAVLLCPLAAFPDTADSVDDVLARMDRAAASFRTLTADVRYVQHTAVINEENIDTGTLRLKRAKRDMQMLVNFNPPDEKTLAVHGQTAEVYNPKIKEVDEYDIGKNKAAVDQFLLVGFGTSGKDIAAAYQIKRIGSEAVSGTDATRLELTPKSPEVLKNMTKLELWIADGEAYPVQQKFYFPSGDYRLVTYTNVKVNPP